MLTNTKRTYALAGLTVEHRAGGWHYWRTYGDKTDIKSPYSSMASVTLMVVIELRRKLLNRTPCINCRNSKYYETPPNAGFALLRDLLPTLGQVGRGKACF